jgi:hypothetical protein
LEDEECGLRLDAGAVRKRQRHAGVRTAGPEGHLPGTRRGSARQGRALLLVEELRNLRTDLRRRGDDVAAAVKHDWPGPESGTFALW